jgi:hypothetical protein
MFVHAIGQITPERKGICVGWAGPHTWLYSPTGWTVQRRSFERGDLEFDCVDLSAQEVAQLRAHHELSIRHGSLTLRTGAWVVPIANLGTPRECEVITLELARVQSVVRVDLEAKLSFAVALRHGKVVGGGTVSRGVASFSFARPEIDTVIVHALGLTRLRVCVAKEDEASWKNVPIVKKLQLPIVELMPALGNADGEYAEAKSRLLPGERLDRTEFESLTASLRLLVRPSPRPIDLAMLLRKKASDSAQELCPLDPIRAALIHPKWRRVLGFAWFDLDRALVPGQVYEYRVVGSSPADDTNHDVFGFHTIPSQTVLPSEFYLGGVRLRIAQPTVVSLAQDDNGALRQITRRGIRLLPRTEKWWQVPSIDAWSLVIDFPEAVTSVALDVEPGHDLAYAFGSPWTSPSMAAPLPAGPRATLDFPSPVHRLLLAGKGFLEAIRVLKASTVTTDAIAAVTGPIPFTDAPLPDPPVLATLTNLQEERAVPTTDRADTPVPAPHELGFEIRFRPAPRAGITSWPPDLPPPPLEAALFQIERRQVLPTSTPYVPVIDDEENYTTGDRSYGAPAPAVHPGVDLLTVFPELRQPTTGSFDLFWRDVFDSRPLPPPGTVHQYRVRAVDAIGRPSAMWTETGTLRLEKHIPPPVPPAPEITSADELSEPAVTGVRARVLVPNAPDLTDEERTILGSHTSAILLTWGWHEQQRRQDPYAREFRLYASRREPSRVRANIVGVVPQGGDRFDAEITADRPLSENAARGAILEAGKLFRILDHAAGANTTLRLRALERDANGGPIAPESGPFDLPIRLTPDQMRAPFWAPRLAVVPIDDRTVYTYTFFDLLAPSPTQPTDVIHVGVSSADAEAYVDDPLAPGSTRPGNESPIAPVRCVARWYGQPVVVEAPSLAPVPVVVTPEPGPRPLVFRLDLTAYSSFPPVSRVRPERVSDDEVFGAYRVSGDHLVARVVGDAAPGDAEQTVDVPNAADRAAIIAALSSGMVSSLEDRFVVFLASAHPYRARLFRAASPDPITLDQFEETLPNRGARWVYRLRLADASDRLSADGVTLPVIVRVPSTTAVTTPVRVERSADRVVLRVAGGREVTHLLVFIHAIASRALAREDVEILRVPSTKRVRLRLPDGALISPIEKSLDDADVVRDGPYRVVTITPPPGEVVRLWACAATRDGVVSRAGGPWRVGA